MRKKGTGRRLIYPPGASHTAWAADIGAASGARFRTGPFGPAHQETPRRAPRKGPVHREACSLACLALPFPVDAGKAAKTCPPAWRRPPWQVGSGIDRTRLGRITRLNRQTRPGKPASASDHSPDLRTGLPHAFPGVPPNTTACDPCRFGTSLYGNQGARAAAQGQEKCPAAAENPVHRIRAVHNPVTSFPQNCPQAFTGRASAS